MAIIDYIGVWSTYRE